MLGEGKKKKGRREGGKEGRWEGRYSLLLFRVMPSRHPISEKLHAPDADGFTKIIKLGEKRITSSASEIGRDRDFHRRGIAWVG